MNGRVAIVGFAQTKHAEDPDETREGMVFKSAKGALEKAGLTREDLDTVINISNDFQDSRTISNVHLSLPSGGYLKDESKVEEDGAFGAFYGMMRILSGTHQVALAVGNTNASTFNPHQISTYILDPTFERQFGLLNDISAAAIQARMYMEKYGVSEEEIASVSVKNLQNASKNPNAQRKMPDLTVEEVLESKLLYDPIRELTAHPLTDGACAVVLASEEKARDITDEPVWIEGVGSCQDTYLRDRDLYKFDALGKAAKRAYEMAGITDPLDVLDVAEVSEKFAHEELMIYESLGLCGEGKGRDLIEGGQTEMDGSIPVNPSGGALSANPECATGLIRMAEAAKQIKGEANGYQVSDSNKALAHAQSGLCAQTNIVFILGGEAG